MAKHKGSDWVGARDGHAVVRTYFLDKADNLSAISTPGRADSPRPPAEAPLPAEIPATAPSDLVQEKWIEVCDSRRRYHTRLDHAASPSSSQEMRHRVLEPLRPEQRRPFAAILDFAELFRRGAPGDLALGFETRQILASVDQLQRRLDGRAASPDEAPISAAAVADDALGRLREVCRTHNLRVQNHLPASLACAPTDAGPLRQSLLNLLLYAVQNSSGPRHVVLVAGQEADKEARPVIHLCFTHAGGLRADPVKEETGLSHTRLTTFDWKKSDLPLLLSERLLASMGGSLRTLALEGYGSAFEIRLPSLPAVQRGKAVPVPHAPGHRGEADSSVTLLYIEDNLDHLVLMERILQRVPGIVYRPARTAEMGLALAFLEVPDIVLLDIRLPRMNGLEILRTMRASPRTVDVRALALSTSAFSHDVDTGRLLGFRHYLTKPFNVAEFVDMLAAEARDCLRARRATPR